MGDNEYQAKRWQKVIRPPEDELERDSDRPGWIRKYLDLADLMFRRVQQRIERSTLRNGNEGHFPKPKDIDRRNAA